MNMWKGRKILIKGLKMVPEGERNLSLTEYMVNYELHFLRKLVERNNILVKGEAPLKFIDCQGQNEEKEDEDEEEKEPQEVASMKLEEYDQLIWIIIEEAFSKNCSHKSEIQSFSSIKARFLRLLRKAKSEEENSEVKVVIDKVLAKLNELESYEGKEASPMKQENELKIEVN